MSEKAGSAQTFSFEVPLNAFADVDAGDSITYGAVTADGGALPAWLSFNAVTRTFSGTPANLDLGTFGVKVTATDTANTSVSDLFVLTVIHTNEAPTNLALSGDTILENAASAFVGTLTTADPDAGDTFSYSILGGGDGTQFAISGDSLIVGADGLDFEAGATRSVSVRATDQGGLYLDRTFTINVTDVNEAPVSVNAIGDQAVSEDSAFSFAVLENAFVDPDAGDHLTFDARMGDDSDLPAWMTFDASSRTFSGTPANDNVGTFIVKVTATDTQGLAAHDTFELTVVNGNDAPILTTPIPDQEATEDAIFGFVVPSDTFADVDTGDDLRFSATLANGDALPSWVNFDALSATFTGIPANQDVGTILIEVTATDGSNASVSDVFSLAVANVNDAPTVADSIVDQQVAEGAIFSFQVPADAFADVDTGEVLAYSTSRPDGSALPAWLGFDASTREFNGAPTAADVGTVAIQVTATDGAGASVSDVFDLIVLGINDAPFVANPLADQSAIEDSAFSFQFPNDTFADADLDDTLFYSANLADGSVLPSWLAFNPSTRSFSGTPTNADVGTIGLRVTATDSSNASVFDMFDLTVIDTNDTPLLDSPILDQTAMAGASFNFAFAADTFDDIDQGDVLFYDAMLASGDPLPAWLIFNGASRTFAGTPGSADAGSLSIRVTATDLADAAATDEFQLTVLGGGQGVHLEGTHRNDVLKGTDHNDTLLGKGGNDRLYGLGGDDLLFGEKGKDKLYGDAGDDVLAGGTGDDHLAGGLGNDVLEGEDGQDHLLGESGDDVLAGGDGNDELEGGLGNDLYVHEKKGGSDVIEEAGGQDVLRFGEGIAANKTRLYRRRDDLLVDLHGSDGSVTIKGWFDSSAKKVERVEFADGTAWDVNYIRSHLERGSAPKPGHDGRSHDDDHDHDHGHDHGHDRDRDHGKPGHKRDDDHDDRKSGHERDRMADLLEAYLAHKPRYDFETLARELEGKDRREGALSASEIARRWKQVGHYTNGLAGERDEDARYGAGEWRDFDALSLLGGGPGGAFGHAGSTGSLRGIGNLKTLQGLEEGFNRLHR